MADPEGGYAASQDADVGLDDDGDYFTWTRDEAAAVSSPDELEVAAAYYDIGTAGEMHHNPGKNVLFISATVPGLAQRTGQSQETIEALPALGAGQAASGAGPADGAVHRSHPLHQLERHDGLGDASGRERCWATSGAGATPC